jgi:Flp pilus assembly protein TadG
MTAIPSVPRATNSTLRSASIAAVAVCSFRRAIGEFLRDQAGSYVIVSGLMMPVLIGMTALGTEVGMWLYKRQTLQSAADSAAISAATAYYYGTDYTTEADGLAASYGFIDGVNGTVITVSRPPTTGNYTSTAGAIEVVVQQPESPLFSALFKIVNFNVRGRAVALANGGTGCTLSLDRTASGGTTVQGTAQVALDGCDLYDDSADPYALNVSGSANISARSVDVVGGISGTDKITVTQDVATDQPFSPDPYMNTQIPSFSGCDSHNFSAKTTVTISPGVYCGGMKLDAGAVVTLNPGIYYLDQGSLSVNGGATLTGSGVTLVFTSSTGQNYATATINGGATVNLTAPDSGPTQGIALYGDRNMPTGLAFKFNGGATQYFGGAVYLPRAAVDFAGGANTSTGCTQLIGDTITFTGNSNLSIDCSGYKTKPVGSAVAKLVE